MRLHYEKELQLSDMNLQREQSQVSELKRQRDLLANDSKKLNNIIREQEEQYQRKKVRARGSRSSLKFVFKQDLIVFINSLIRKW